MANNKTEVKELEKLKKSASDFKKFISRGNVVDMAVGVIVGGAFGKIVTSLVNDMLMPLIGVLLGGLDFSGLTLTFNNANINYGIFIQNVVDFLIIAFCLFMFIKFVNRLSSKKEDKNKKAAPVPSDEVVLLREIRDLLKEEK